MDRSPCLCGKQKFASADRAKVMLRTFQQKSRKSTFDTAGVYQCVVDRRWFHIGHSSQVDYADSIDHGEDYQAFLSRTFRRRRRGR